MAGGALRARTDEHTSELRWSGPGPRGDIPGYETRGGATRDGRAVSVAVTALPTTDAGGANVLAALDEALCH